jgi:hypothetical protein
MLYSAIYMLVCFQLYAFSLKCMTMQLHYEKTTTHSKYMSHMMQKID